MWPGALDAIRVRLTFLCRHSHRPDEYRGSDIMIVYSPKRFHIQHMSPLARREIDCIFNLLPPRVREKKCQSPISAMPSGDICWM